jgi:alpha/beta superfamily hydrolase
MRLLAFIALSAALSALWWQPLAGAGSRPAAPAILGSSVGVAGEKLTFRFKSSGAARFRCSVDSTRLKICRARIEPKLKKGGHVVRAQAVDKLGRRSAISVLAIEVLAASKRATFSASDGTLLSGRVLNPLNGELGLRAIVLAHQANEGQAIWFPLANRLAESGYLVLTFNFRGYCSLGACSQGSPTDYGQMPLDVAAASAYVRTLGAQRVTLIGASMGGAEIIRAAAYVLDVQGLVALSPPYDFPPPLDLDKLRGLSQPKLLVESRNDLTAGSVKRYFDQMTEQKTLLFYPGSAHGVALFRGPNGKDLWAKLLVFLRGTSGYDRKA